MKRIASIALAAVSMAAWAPAAGAADDDKSLIPESWVPGKFSANVGVVSEYIFRGLSQTDDTPALQGGFDWNLESIAGSPVGLYAGFWGSNVDFKTGNHLETDWYAGLQGNIAPIDTTWKLGGLYYLYPRAPTGSNQSYGELTSLLSHDFGLAAFTVGFNYSPDFFGGSGDAEYLSFKLDIPIWKFTLSPIAGRQWIEKNAVFGVPDYWHYGAALTTKIVGFDATVAVSDTNIRDSKCNVVGGVAALPTDPCGPQVTFMLSRTF